MALKHLLVHLDAGDRTEERLRLAVTLARRSGAVLSGLFAESATIGPSIVGRRSPQNMEKARDAARAAFEAHADAAGVVKEWQQLSGGEYSQIVEWTTVCCRYADLAVFGQHPPDHARVPEDTIEQVLTDSGRPVLVVPHTGRYPDLGRRVLVAWTGSRESARALNDAIPLMEGAEVTVLSFEPPSQRGVVPVPRVDVVSHLRSHGIEAVYERTIVDDLSVVDAVLNRAADLGADLTVIGAYGLQGPPLPQRRATTRSILRSMTTPVLLSC